jgi:hypothetical protein
MKVVDISPWTTAQWSLLAGIFLGLSEDLGRLFLQACLGRPTGLTSLFLPVNSARAPKTTSEFHATRLGAAEKEGRQDEPG